MVNLKQIWRQCFKKGVKCLPGDFKVQYHCGLTSFPANPHVEALTSITLECNCIWR